MKVTSLMKRKSVDDQLVDRPSPTARPDGYRAWLKASVHDTRLDELRERRRFLGARLVELEAGDSEPRSPSEIRVEARVQSLLGGGETSAMSTVTAAQECREELLAIERAIEILGHRKNAELCEKIRGELILRRDEAHDLAYRRAMWALEGRRLHAESEAFAKGLAGGPTGLGPIFPGAAVNLGLLYAAGSAPLKQLIEQSLSAGIITKTEVKS